MPEAETLQNSTPEADTPQKQKLSVTLPNTVTIGVWIAFQEGRQAYVDKQTQNNASSFGLIADWHGAAKVVQDGFVHLGGDGDMVTKVRTALTEGRIDGLDARIVGWVVRQIAGPINRSVLDPLPE